MKKDTNKSPECECGCGGTTKGGRFIPGHDAKLKKSLIEAALGGSKRAANKLEALGWTKFLDAKRTKTTQAKKIRAEEPSVPSELPPEVAPRPRRGRPPKRAAGAPNDGQPDSESPNPSATEAGPESPDSTN